MNFPTTINPESKRFLPHGTDSKPLVSKGFFIMETWKAVDGTNGKILVSNYARIKSFVQSDNGKILKVSSIDKAGYKHISFSINGKRKSHLISRLVATYFVPNPNCKPHVNHIDGNKANNHFKNLEWVTISENLKHAFSIGLIKPRNGVKSNFAKINEAIANSIRKEFNCNGNKMQQYSELSVKYKLSERQIRNIIYNKIWI